MNLSDQTHKFRDQSLDIEERLDDLMSQLTIEEKFELCSGKNFFKARGVKRLGIQGFAMTDGPVGVAFHSSLKRNTYFPATIGLAASWNRQLCAEFGESIAKETRAAGRSMILGPGINICRTPLNGRTFEYLGEDPFQNAQLAVPMIKAIQAQKVSACVKHFVANNQETQRMRVDVQVSKRALEEIYFPAFKAAVEEGDAWSVMACYNRVNGLYGCENPELLRERLVEDWGFSGFVVSDWFAARNTESAGACVEAGLALDMPGNMPPIPKVRYRMRPKSMKSSFERNEFTESALYRNVRAYLKTQIRTGAFDDPATVPKGERNTPAIRKIARKIAEESMVLLKNENKILPLNEARGISSIAIIGPNKNKRMAYLGYGGSSAVWPPYEITPYRGLKEKAREKGIRVVTDIAAADVAILVMGLSHRFGEDSEGFDRKTLDLPLKQVQQINACKAKNPNTIVVLVSGSAVSMDAWIEGVPAVLQAWYVGMEGGHALADIIFGDVNPSGKLPITFPRQLSDSPAHVSERTFPGDEKVYYDEGVFVGYRHFDKDSIEPLYPFGFGLSYSEYEYSNLVLDRQAIGPNDCISMEIDIKNLSDIAGSEVIQLYVSEVNPSVERPPKELKGFEKMFLEAGQAKTVKMTLQAKDLAYFDEAKDAWFANAGEYEAHIAASSRDIRATARFKLDENAYV